MQKPKLILLVALFSIASLVIGLYASPYVLGNPGLASYYTFENAPYCGASYIVYTDSGIYYSRNVDTGVVTSGTNATTILLSNINTLQAASGGLILIKAGTYTVSCTIPTSPSLNVLLQGEGNATLIAGSGAFDAVNKSAIRMTNLLWRDASGVLYDATVDPNMFGDEIADHLNITERSKKLGISIWDWASNIDVYNGTTVTDNTNWAASGGTQVFYKTGVQGYIDAICIVTNNTGQPTCWLYIDDWDILAFANWGIKNQYGIFPNYLTTDNISSTLYRSWFVPTEPIYFASSVGLKLSNTSTSVNATCSCILISLRFISPDIIGRPHNEVAAYNDIASDHTR